MQNFFPGVVVVKYPTCVGRPFYILEKALYSMTKERPDCNVVVADDYPPDLELLVRTFKTLTHFHISYQALDGAEVIAYFKGDPPFNDRKRFPWPHLLILDLKMPLTNGFDVLDWIQSHQVPKLVIVVLTGSENPDDAIRARNMGADAVYIKPVSLDHIREMVSRIERFMETAPKGITC